MVRLELKSYSKRKPFWTQSAKGNCFADRTVTKDLANRTVTEDLANRTAQKQ